MILPQSTPGAPNTEASSSKPDATPPRWRKWAPWAAPLISVLLAGGVLRLTLGRDWGARTLALVAPSDASGFWTAVGALANIAVLAVAAYGLRSITVAVRSLELTRRSLELTRRGLVTQATRDARLNAIQRCEEFANEIISLNRPILLAIASAKVPAFVHEAADVQFDPDPVGRLNDAVTWILSLPPGAEGAIVTLLNRLEAWSMYFTKQLADPTIAYGPCAPYFCTLVVQNYARLLLARNDDASSGKYPNLVELFTGWNSQLNAEKRGLLAGELIKQAEQLQRTGGPMSRLPGPLGMDLDA